MVYISKGKNKYNSDQLTLLKIKMYTVYTIQYIIMYCIYTQWSEKFWSNLIQTIKVHELYK